MSLVPKQRVTLLTSLNSIGIVLAMRLSEYLVNENLSQEEFGKRVGSGVSQGMVWQWLAWLDDPSKGTRITAERAIQIEVATSGRVGRSELRPDVFAPPQPAVVNG